MSEQEKCPTHGTFLNAAGQCQFCKSPQERLRDGVDIRTIRPGGKQGGVTILRGSR